MRKIATMLWSAVFGGVVVFAVMTWSDRPAAKPKRGPGAKVYLPPVYYPERPNEAMDKLSYQLRNAENRRAQRAAERHRLR